MTDLDWKCPNAVCEAWNAIGLTVCPDCGYNLDKNAQKAPETALTVSSRPGVTITEAKGLLSFAAYKDLSPNKVSKEEYNRYLYLHTLQDSGVISNLETQVSYDLLAAVKIPGINWYTYKKPDGKTRKGFTQGATDYSPDFRYQYEGVTVIEEYKGIRKTKADNLKPRIDTTARNKVKLWVTKYSEYLISGEWFFCISGWYPKHKQYYVFDSNGNIIDYPLMNYDYLEKIA